MRGRASASARKKKGQKGRQCRTCEVAKSMPTAVQAALITSSVSSHPRLLGAGQIIEDGKCTRQRLDPIHILRGPLVMLTWLS